MNEKFRGLVLYGNGVEYRISTENGEIDAKLRGRLLHVTKRSHHPVCAGDYVEILVQKDGSYYIDKILPRKNRISRPANLHFRKEQVLSANIDILFIINSVVEPPLNPAFIDRLLVFSDNQDIDTYLVVNKSDLGIDELDKYYIEGYEQIGVKIIETSVKDGKNIDLIADLCKGKVASFIGKSGVGKSSILNAIDDTILQKVGAISDFSSKGKHTTKQARLFPLKEGGFIIDTPGIKEFGLWQIRSTELKNHFPEFREYSSQCKYYNCNHLDEPHCRVKEAVEDGDIPDFRYENYIKIFESLTEYDDELNTKR
ncbi:MAG: ribosome small subunit-dependent GTPase A [Candidatus Delongbacteria bacterium]|nr:ribosome small subunit-dependent GTPase A [Candidatus Delongbacteria bacterium]MBN2833977.1 ribosome small subunit-dependent GTPase A [Candidatus Delongbacteria bacterium]